VNLPRAQHVQAAVTDVTHDAVTTQDQHHGEGGAHAGLAIVGGGHGKDFRTPGVDGELHGVEQFVAGLGVVFAGLVDEGFVLLQHPLHGLGSVLGRHFACRVTSHAITNDVELEGLINKDYILVVVTFLADVGFGDSNDLHGGMLPGTRWRVKRATSVIRRIDLVAFWTHRMGMQRVSTAAEAIADIPAGATLMVGGFGLCGNPESLLAALHSRGTGGLTIISNNCGTTDKGLGLLLANGQVNKMVSSYVGENKEFERRYLSGELDVELNPQGTLAERIRAGGAGIPAFFTATGVGTAVSDGGLPLRYHADGSIAVASPPKDVRTLVDPRTGKPRAYVMETGLFADFALVRAHVADEAGNLMFRKTARNFSPMMCTAARITIVEAERIVPVGSLDPDHIHVPAVYVKRLLLTSQKANWIEQRTVRPRPTHVPA
jgi:3-oxoacid CoA-transferase subunit A